MGLPGCLRSGGGGGQRPRSVPAAVGEAGGGLWEVGVRVAGGRGGGGKAVGAALWLTPERHVAGVTGGRGFRGF